ncbi:MAG: alpha/beta hydrolase [Bryobacterales bacterium]
MQITVDGHPTYVESRGQGKVILFIHGLGGTCSIWFPQAQSLAAHYQTIVYDWLGSGNSDKPAAEYTIESWADQAAQLCAALGVSGAGVVGHSLGAAVAVTLAAQHPDLVRAAALVGPVTKLPDGAVAVIQDRAAKVLTDGMGPLADALPMGALSEATRASSPVTHAFFRALVLGNDPKCYAAHCQALVRADADRLLGQVPCPVLLIAGDKDPTAPIARVETIAAQLANSKLVVVPDGGHAMQLDQPDLVSDTLRDFFDAALQRS